jgi:hypothetical protein
VNIELSWFFVTSQVNNNIAVCCYCLFHDSFSAVVEDSAVIGNAV